MIEQTKVGRVNPLKVGFIGWRGMVGSVLMQRMEEEGDFQKIKPVFFTTSQAGQAAPKWASLGIGPANKTLLDAYSVDDLSSCDVLISCQGSDYTHEVHGKLRSSGWNGYWIDAASALRMSEHSVIILDPVNLPVIEKAIDRGIKDFVGGNCTVSLMLMALNGLFERDLVEWVNSMTYQSASGAGAANMRELITQMGTIYGAVEADLKNPASSILDIDRCVTHTLRQNNFPKIQFGYPLAANVLPWIDSDLDNGMSREEWKGGVEANKILGKAKHGEQGSILVDGLCVRVGAMRCHSQALTFKVKQKLSVEQIAAYLASANPWVRVIENKKENSLSQLTPAAVSGGLNIHIGRIRKTVFDEHIFSAFTVGDQLLWGAAEPLRRMLVILL
jgi:aspartate-semialdehyde dehydrogenase